MSAVILKPNKMKYIETRMTTFIKTKFKISYDQTNIDKYRLSANITEYHAISKSILQRIVIPKFMMIRQFPIERKKIG